MTHTGRAPPVVPPSVESKRPCTSLPRVACYNCDTINLLDGTPKQWCRACPAPLAPAPAWVKALGWPDKPVPARERRKMHNRASTPVKAVRFDSDDGRSLAGALEIVAKRDGVRMNELILSLLRSGLEQHEARRSRGNGGVDGG